jgi:cytoskeletal protein CcmA (bactofilin family)
VNFIKKFLNKKKRQKEIVTDFHTTIIRVDSNFISTSSIILDEKLIANIYSLKEVTLDSSAEISGDITSRRCEINGKVIGDITSTEFACIKSNAIISGNIRAKSLKVEIGSIINGFIRIEGDIDERDLIEKIENRLPPKTQNEIISIPYLIPKPVEAEQDIVFTTVNEAGKSSQSNEWI